MNESRKKETLSDVLQIAAEKKQRIRFYGANMVILAEGIIEYVGDGVVAVRHSDDQSADEFIVKSAIIKIQYLPEYSHY